MQLIILCTYFNKDPLRPAQLIGPLLITVFDPVICKSPDAPYIVCNFAGKGKVIIF